MFVKALQEAYYTFLFVQIVIIYFSHDRFFVEMDQRDQKPSLFT